MIKRISKPIVLKALIFILLNLFISEKIYCQDTKTIVTGKIMETYTKVPLGQVFVSASGTDSSVVTDIQGQFEISVNDLDGVLTLQLPGYTVKQVYLKGQSDLNIFLNKTGQKSIDDELETPFGIVKQKNILYNVDYLNKDDLEKSSTTTVDEALQGKVKGLNMVRLSGLPGARGSMNIGGISSLYGAAEPTIIIDGMIRDINYPEQGSVAGFTLNPLDILDIDDIENISVLKDAQSYLGSRASNGVIYINSEQKGEVASVIKLHVYQGIVTSPKKLSLMDAGQYKQHLDRQVLSQEINLDEADNILPGVYGTVNARYQNNTDWQDIIFSPGHLSKYHLFLKGGDKIAHYNISFGYLGQNGIIDKTRYTRFNLKLNGKINISKRFSFSPDFKLGLSNSDMTDQGPNKESNPILSSVLKSPLMKPSSNPGDINLNYLEDIGVFQQSNPLVVVNDVYAKGRNFQVMSSGKFMYTISDKLSLSSLIGLDYDKAWDKIFIPDFGLPTIDSVRNSMGASVTEYRSVQNNSEIKYNNVFDNGNKITLQLGSWITKNTYNFGYSYDVNSATDDFRSVGKGGEDKFLRETTGGIQLHNWISSYATTLYVVQDKYYLNGGISYEGNSSLNKSSRYNIFPFLGAAWRILSQNTAYSKINDLKIRISWGLTGNLINPKYMTSRLYYQGERLLGIGRVVRNFIPNEELEMEKKSTINLGTDLVAFGNSLNTSLNVFYSTVNNLIIIQKLPDFIGYTEYYDNGASLKTIGVNFSTAYGFLTGSSLWNIGINLSAHKSDVSRLDFIYENSEMLITSIGNEDDAFELVTKLNGPVYQFYGYKTEGKYSSEAEANTIIGPNGEPMQNGDVKFSDTDGNDTIDFRDKLAIGNPEPIINGGFNVSYFKNKLKVDLNFTYSLGNEIYNYVGKLSHSNDGYNNQSIDIAETNNEYHDASFNDPRGNNVFSDLWLEDGSYVKLKSLTVSYNFSSATRYYKNLVVYFTGSDLFTLSKYSGYDPEVMYLNNPVYRGIDYGKMPYGRKFIMGVRLGL